MPCRALMVDPARSPGGGSCSAQQREPSSGSPAEGKSLGQESDTAQSEFLTFWPLVKEHASKGATRMRPVGKPL